MSALSVAAGVLLVLVVAREVFHTLFHPGGQGSLTIGVFKSVWAVTGSLGGRGRRVAGPLSMVLVIALWVGLTVLGWALIYLPALPEGFIFASPLTPAAERSLLDAVYVAWVTQSTLGYGDIAPHTGLLRLLAPLQATFGFGLFTLVVTWVLSVYPALQRQRSAATHVHALLRSHERNGWAPTEIHPATLARQLERTAGMLNAVRVDFAQYPSTFYFAAPTPTMSLARALPYAIELAEADGYSAEASPAAAELSAAIELFAASVGQQHLGMSDASAADVTRAYRRHHGLSQSEAAT